MKKIISIFATSGLYFTATVQKVLAANSPPGIPPNSGGIKIKDSFSPANVGSFNSVGDLVTALLTVLISLAGGLAVVFIIISGIKFITGAGDDKKMESARNTLFYAIIGLVVTALAFGIMQLVQFIIGSKVSIT